MLKLKEVVGYWVNFIRRAMDACQSSYQLSRIIHKWEHCYINGPGYFTYPNIELGEGVYIGKDCTLMCSDSKIKIGDNVVFGPHVFVIAGNHRFDVVGTPLKFVHTKRPEDDKDIIIGEECWIGANTIILNGSVIGRGCIIGAGAIVTKEIPPYSIFTNKGIRPRFCKTDILEHEWRLYNRNYYDEDD